MIRMRKTFLSVIKRLLPGLVGEFIVCSMFIYFLQSDFFSIQLFIAVIAIFFYLIILFLKYFIMIEIGESYIRLYIALFKNYPILTYKVIPFDKVNNLAYKNNMYEMDTVCVYYLNGKKEEKFLIDKSYSEIQDAYVFLSEKLKDYPVSFSNDKFIFNIIDYEKEKEKRNRNKYKWFK